MHRAPQELRTYHVTAVTAQRRSLFQVTTTAELLIDVLETNRIKSRFQLHAFVVMRDHLHVLLTPAPDVSLEKAVQFIKGGFSFRLKSKFDVWERGYNEAQIKTPEQFVACRKYIEQNPVRKGYVESAELYPFSSASKVEAIDACPEWFRVTVQG